MHAESLRLKESRSFPVICIMHLGKAVTLLPCLPCTRLESFMRAREFCLGVAAWVPAARVTVCGKALLGPPRLSRTMSKLQTAFLFP